MSEFLVAVVLHPETIAPWLPQLQQLFGLSNVSFTDGVIKNVQRVALAARTGGCSNCGAEAGGGS